MDGHTRDKRGTHHQDTRRMFEVQRHMEETRRREVEEGIDTGGEERHGNLYRGIRIGS